MNACDTESTLTSSVPTELSVRQNRSAPKEQVETKRSRLRATSEPAGKIWHRKSMKERRPTAARRARCMHALRGERLEVEEAIRRYKSIRNWFIRPNGERRYKPTTERMYIKRMEIWCNLTRKTPDELANEDIDRMRGIIAERLKERFVEQGRRVVIRIVGLWINSLNSFWKYNRRQVKEKYGGISEPLRKEIRRLAKIR